jgi:integrase
MQTLSEFVRAEFVPQHLKKRDHRTVAEYQTTVNLVTEILEDPGLHCLGMQRNDFVKTLEARGLEPATIAKHLRHLNAIFKQFPEKYRIHWAPIDVPETTPKVVLDNEFQALYRAFCNEKQYPKYLAAKNRPLFWQTIMEFVAVVAVRREAVLSLEWCNVNTKERYVTVEEWQDKKHRRRFKPLTADLLEKMLELKACGGVTGPKRHCLFPWVHCQKTWYQVWNRAQLEAGNTIGLHDLKRFSGELALRAGASELELMQHMDHANISTTLKHYCRPKTTDLVNRMKVPLPMEFEPPPPEDPIIAENERRVNAAHQWLDEQRLARLLAAGIDLHRLAEAIRETSCTEIIEQPEQSKTGWRTAGGTVLTVFGGESEVDYA